MNDTYLYRRVILSNPIQITPKMAESSVQEALRKLAQNPQLKVAPVAREFGICARTLQRRIQGTNSRFDRIPTNRALNEVEEGILLAQISQFDAMGLHMRKSTLCTAANRILEAERDPSEKRTVDSQWARRWLSRHPEIRQMKQKPIELARKEAEQPHLIKDWLRRTYQKIDELGIDLSDLWNMDETGFRIGIARSQWILTRDNKDQTFIASETDRETCTIIESVSALGSVIDPFLILKGKTILSGWFRDESLSNSTIVAVSETGWTNDELGFEWLKHFDRCTEKGQKGLWRMLILDNHASHESWEFAEYALEKKIYLWGLPSHTSHILQPLDLSVFGPFKHWHSEAVDSATRLGCTKFNKIEFLHAISSIRKQTFKRGTILRGWSESGIYPRNPNIVLRRLGPRRPIQSVSFEVEPHSDDLQPEIEQEWPDTPPQAIVETVPLTPRTPRSLKRLAKQCESDIHLLSEDNIVRRRFGKLQKGARIQAGLQVQTQSFLFETEAAKIARSTRQTGPGNQTHVQKGGHIRADEARKIARQKIDSSVRKPKPVSRMEAAAQAIRSDVIDRMADQE